jgi:hypothetical protein
VLNSRTSQLQPVLQNTIDKGLQPGKMRSLPGDVAAAGTALKVIVFLACLGQNLVEDRVFVNRLQQAVAATAAFEGRDRVKQIEAPHDLDRLPGRILGAYVSAVHDADAIE